MADKRKRSYSIGRFLLNFVTIIPTIFTTVYHLGVMVEQEARMTGKKIITLCVLLVLLLTLLSSTWLCLLTILFFFFMSLNLTIQMSLLFILIINLLFLIIIALVVNNLKRDLFFPETRELIKTIYKRS